MDFGLGNIEYVEVIENEITVTGHYWVALALAHHNAYAVTRFVGITPPGLTSEQIQALRGAADVYVCEIITGKSGASVKFTTQNPKEIQFSCSEVIQEFRYYTGAELNQILKWLPAQSTTDQMRKHIKDIALHGFLVIESDGEFTCTSVDEMNSSNPTLL